MAFSVVIGAICSFAADLLVLWDLTERIGQHWCITDVASSNLDSLDLQCFLRDPEVDLAPDAALTALWKGVGHDQYRD